MNGLTPLSRLPKRMIVAVIVILAQFLLVLFQLSLYVAMNDKLMMVDSYLSEASEEHQGCAAQDERFKDSMYSSMQYFGEVIDDLKEQNLKHAVKIKKVEAAVAKVKSCQK